MVYTYSGHRNHPGQQGLKLNSKIYSFVDDIYGPSSWSVYWVVIEGNVFCFDDIDSPVLHRIASIEEKFTDDGKTMSDILMSDMNILVNLCEGTFNGFEVTASTIKANEILKAYFKNMQIRINYVNQTRVHGWHGIEIKVGEKSYCRHFCWPGTTDKGYETIMASIRRLIDVKRLQLLAM